MITGNVQEGGSRIPSMHCGARHAAVCTVVPSLPAWHRGRTRHQRPDTWNVQTTKSGTSSAHSAYIDLRGDPCRSAPFVAILPCRPANCAQTRAAPAPGVQRLLRPVELVYSPAYSR